MRKLRILILAATLFSATALIIAPGHAINGTTQGDPSDDLISKFLNFRGAYAKEPTTPQLDITEHSFSTARPLGTPAHDAGYMTFTAKFAGAWPKPGADPLGPDGFPTGVTTLTSRWVYALNQNEANVMTRRTPVGQTCSNKETTYNIPGIGASKPIRYKVSECNPITSGPYHPIDGFVLVIWVDAITNDDGLVQYVWARAIYDPLIGTYFYTPGQDHDTAACSWISVATSQSQEDSRAGCKDASYKNPPAPVPSGALFGGGRYDKDGNLIGSDWGTTDRKTITLRIPYNFRDDLTDDGDGLADETRTYSLMGVGNTVDWFTTFSSGTVSVNIPPDDKLYVRDILNPLKDQTGVDAQSYLPPPYNDPNYGTQTGFGVLFNADWAPGNPFTTGSGIPVPAPASSYIQGLCLGTACGPDWGGFLPQVIGPPPTIFDQPGGWLAGLNTGFCRNSSYFVGSTPSGATTHVVDDPLGGFTVWGPGPGGTQLLDVPGVPGSQDLDGDGKSGTQTGPLPTGGDDPCYNIKNNSGPQFVNTGNGFQAA